MSSQLGAGLSLLGGVRRKKVVICINSEYFDSLLEKKTINRRVHNATLYLGGNRNDPSDVYLLTVFCTRLSS